ncbi:hypothetical protein [Microbacterium sp. CIAB417]|uniref:hypothetical protein n=1 Tax=Microbacterium sp. CIAB417 TaxID=2860287 RepID=UPI001FAD25C2|nr:hypothetical protein [Microbacterium sp. CIAB417]
MTTRPAVSSTPILRATLLLGTIVGVVLTVAAAAVGFFVAGGEGLASGLVGALIGAVFPAFTALSILIANRWFGTPAYLQIFFGVVLGGWLLKFVLVIVALVVLTRVDWVVPLVFYFSLLATAVASLVVDLVVLARMRMPAASDVVMPTLADTEGEGGEDDPDVADTSRSV